MGFYYLSIVASSLYFVTSYIVIEYAWKLGQCLFFGILLLTLRRGKMQTLSSKYKLTRLILQVGCPPYNLILYWKLALIQKSSTQIPKVFHEHGNALIHILKWFLFQDTETNISIKTVSCMGRGILQGHDNKLSRPSESFMIDRTQLKLKKYWFLKLQISAVCLEK